MKSLAMSTSLKMTRSIWILALFGIITGATTNTVSYPHHSAWLFGVRDESVSEQSRKGRSLCETKQCNTLAKILTQSMNETADPCEDFYEYACGNWKIHNPLPENEKHWNLLVKLQRDVDKSLLEILEEDSNPSLLAVKLAKRAYKACMDTDELERRGLQPILSTLWRIGGWPLIMEEDEWAEEIHKWKRVDDYYAHLIGLHSLFDIRVGELDWKAGVTSLLIDTPHLPYKMYRLLRKDDIIDMDSSDEDNDSREGSQERGSEERRGSEEDENDENDNEDDEDDANDNEDDEDEEELRIKGVAKKRMNKQQGLNKKKRNNVKEIQKHVGKQKMKNKTKRIMVQTNGHKRRQLKQSKVINHRAHRGTKERKRVLNHKQMTLRNHVRKSVKRNNLGNKGRKEDTNNDIYFGTNDSEDEGDIDLEEDGDVNNDSEWEAEDGSGSGDDNTEWDDENGSGSGDYHDDEGDDEEGDSEEDEDEDKDVEELRKKYAEYMFNVSSALAQARGVPISEEKLAEDVEELLQFQLTLLKLIINSEKMMNTTLRSFQKSYDALNATTNKSKINWIRTVQDLFDIGGMEIDEDAIVGIESFEYIEAIRKLLDETPSRIVVNYIHWNFVSRVIKATTKEMRTLYYEWQGNEPDEGRSNECIDEIEAKYCLGYEYVKRYFSDDILETASDMVDDIEKEVEYQIKESTWIDDDTKDFILDKLVYLKKFLGYPIVYRNTTAMKDYMRGLSISPSHYENKLGIMRYVKRENLKKLFANKDDYQDYIDPLIVNAFFAPAANFIEITAADFQSPMFDSHQPWYANFGIIGLIIGHEVNHGFDDTGHLFDKRGNYVKWLSAMAEAYEKRADCYEEQYTRYSVVEKRTGNISIEKYGEQTIDENIADSMGLQAVFRAYQRRQRECKNPDPMLPGFQNFTNEQMFFISFANLWCEVVNPEMTEMQLKRDSHSLGPLRVIGPVSNSEDFAKVFKCPEGSPMNPKKKCNIWI